MTQTKAVAAIGTQLRPDGSALSALRSMVSDLSNSLLSLVIAHFHPARCSSRANGVIVALVVPLTAGLHVSLQNGASPRRSQRQRPPARLQIPFSSRERQAAPVYRRGECHEFKA